MGALYVMEGSTLGGRYIYKMLQGHPSLEVPVAALHFFNGYGEATSQRWKSFGAALNSLPLHQDEIVRSAEETFRLFAQWIRQTLYHE